MICIWILIICDNPLIQAVKTFMFDLFLDPTESESTHSDSSYDDVKTYMESRIPSYWMAGMNQPDITDNPGEDTVKGYWDKCRNICSWIENKEERAIDLKYIHKSAPNIVFVLVDDWGYNDVGFRSDSMSWTTPNIDKLAKEGIKLNNYFTHETCIPSRGGMV